MFSVGGCQERVTPPGVLEATGGGVVDAGGAEAAEAAEEDETAEEEESAAVAETEADVLVELAAAVAVPSELEPQALKAPAITTIPATTCDHERTSALFMRTPVKPRC